MNFRELMKLVKIDGSSLEYVIKKIINKTKLYKKY